MHPNSPALLAGLQPFTDYIIGADSVLHESEDLYALIENHEGRNLKLYVYNSNDDSCREITITPNHGWGGEGLLGCGIGYGYLHRIPVRGIAPPTVTSPHNYSNINPPIIHPEEPVRDKRNSTTTIEPSIDETTRIPNEFVDAPNNPVPPTDNQLVAPNENPYRNKSSSFASHIPPPSSIPQFDMNDTNFQPINTTLNSQSIPSPLSILQYQNAGVPVVDPAYNQVNMVPMYPVNYGQLNNTIDSFPLPNPFVPQIPTQPEINASTENSNVNGNIEQQPPLMFNPEIAAQSAQQLLQSNPYFRLS